MRYSDAARLCFRLWLTVDGVPQCLCPLTKEIICDSFAELARIGWVLEQENPMPLHGDARWHKVADRGHWIQVILAILKKKPDEEDSIRGEELASLVGFIR